MAFLLDLAQAAVLRDGDGLLLDDGRRIRIVAAAEKLLEVRCAAPQELARVAWHLGNRHLAVEVADGVIRLRDDYVIADMLRHMGAEVTVTNGPFNPEGGAYGESGHTHHQSANAGHHHHE